MMTNVRGLGHPVIMVRSREGPARARTLAFMWQKANRRAAAEKAVRKIEAEAIAVVVAQTIGLSTGRALRRGSRQAFSSRIRPASRQQAARLYSGRQSIRGHSRISWFNYGLDI